MDTNTKPKQLDLRFSLESLPGKSVVKRMLAQLFPQLFPPSKIHPHLQNNKAWQEYAESKFDRDNEGQV